MIFGGVLFLVGTLLRWLGIVLLLRGMYCLVRAFAPSAHDIEKAEWRKRLLINAGIGAAALVIGGPFLTFKTAAAGAVTVEPGSLNLPLIWVSMPFAAWVTVGAVIGAIVVACQLMLEVDREGKLAKAKAIGAWLLAAVGGALFYAYDTPGSKTGPSIEIFKGYLPLHWTVALGLIVLLCVSVGFMAATVRAAKARGWGRIAVIQSALIVGSLTFSLPFLWLLVTSFKEDQDMASANGIIWVPKVTQTVNYMDPVDPWFEGSQDGESFVGDIQSKNPDGTWTMNVIHPQSIAGDTFIMKPSQLKEVSKPVDVVTGTYQGVKVQGMNVQNFPDGRVRVHILDPVSLKGKEYTALAKDIEKVRHVGLDWKNYPDALDLLPPSAHYGLVYLDNTLILVILNVLGTILSSSIVAYAFSRMRFPGKMLLFTIVLSTMMLPAAVTLLPTFLIFRTLGWIDTLKPLWVPAFFASAFNIFLLRQFFMQVPMELEDAAKIDGSGYLKTFWSIMLPQVKPALAVIGIWTFMGTWGDLMGPLIYISSPEKMPLTYALALFNGSHGGEYGPLMAFTTLTIIPVVLVFFFLQKYFIEGVSLSGLGGR